MEKMKKAMLVFMMMIVAGALAACGDDASKDNPAKPETEAADSGATDAADGEASSEDVDPTDPNFDKIIELLKAEGLEVGEKTTGYADIDGATQVMSVVINGEDMLPFQVYMMEPDSENLKSAKEKGEVTMEFEGQSGQIPMEAKDDFLYFIADGHPDHDKVYDVMVKNFNQE